MTQGQITNETKLASIIKTIIKEEKPLTIVEFGTWKGLGSTKQLIDGIQASNYTPDVFLSLETNRGFFDIANKNLKDYKDIVTLVRGRIIEVDEIKSYAETITEVPEGQDLNKVKQFFEEDIDNYEECENVLEELPEKIDLLILDGGEISTYLEWLELKDRANIVVLDDTKMLKTKRIVDEVSVDDNFKLIEKSEERNGYYVFRKK